jgi:small subunit ribosomal protein S19
MTRSLRKGPFVDGYLLKKAKKVKESIKFETIKTWSRRSVIVPFFVGLTFEVHNGKKFIPVVIDEDKVGRKLGEFSPTRTFNGHTSDKKVKRQ